MWAVASVVIRTRVAVLLAVAAIVLAILAIAIDAAGAATPTPEQVRRVRAALRVDPVLANRADRLHDARQFLAGVHWTVSVVQYVSAVDAARSTARAAAGGRGSSPRRTATTGSLGAGGRCGGDLPPCYVMARESGGDITAENPTSTASGKWQFLDSTWHNVTGLSGSASDYPESVQDQAAAKAWAGGAGCGHWSAC